VITGLDWIEIYMGPVVFREICKTFATDNVSELNYYKGIETSFAKSQ
jgi:hypothetical protein